MKRNKYNAPVGVVLNPDDAGKLRHLRVKDAAGQLSAADLKAGKAYFLKAYPDPKKSQAASDDILGEDEDGPTVEEMKAALTEAGVTFGANAKDETIQKKYDALSEED